MLAIWQWGLLGAMRVKYVTPLFLEKQKFKIKAIKVVLELKTLAKQ